MRTGTPSFIDAPPPTDQAAPKTRDAGNTRQLLLDAARRRFARDGYTATKVRDIAADAGVNMSLINRYFASKEGLFEACLAWAVETLDDNASEPVTVDRIVASMLRHIVEPPGGELPVQLLLLLRSSGDEGADEVRRATMKRYAEKLAEAAGWTPGAPDSDALLLRAQIAISTAMGMVWLRSPIGVEPLLSASRDELVPPLRAVFSALLDPPADAKG